MLDFSSLHTKIYWLALLVGLYWAYCIYWGIQGAKSAKTATDYFIAGRGISLWVFILAATATSFSGWTFVGHPGTIFTHGFQYAYASFYAITIPFTGVMFLKRQWILSKRFGYITPGEMYSDYFKGDAIRLLTVIVAMLFSVPYLAIQLRASGSLFNILSDGLVPLELGILALSAVVVIYVASGGLRSVAYVDTVQCILLAVGIIITGFIALDLLGGWAGLNAGLADIAATDSSKYGLTADGHNSYFAIPGVIQFTAGLGVESPIGGIWTGTMILTYMFALMGIQSSPAFSMWAFSNNSPKPFAGQQVWASSFGIGIILFVFTAAQGMGAILLGGSESVNDAGLAIGNIFTPETLKNVNNLVPIYINQIADSFPWLVGVLAVCALAAMQSTGAAYMSTAGAMITRDLYKHFINPKASHGVQKAWGRGAVLLITLIAVYVAINNQDAIVLLGGLAVAYGFQMWPALVAICWVPWLTRQGVTLGLVAGLIAVTLTEKAGLQLASLVGIELAWGRWPLTIHSAGWGIFFNVLVTVAVSARTQCPTARKGRETYHAVLAEYSTLSSSKKSLVPVAWVLTIAWFIFGTGPGAVIGNTIFGLPADSSTWTFGIPSIWAWQFLFLILGVAMMWFLAYFMEMSTPPKKAIKNAKTDWGDSSA